MFTYLFLLFIVLPVVEILVLVRIGQATIWWVPIAMVIVMVVAGTALARWQGLKVLERIREDMRAGRVPADSLIDGFLVFLAGILFVLPGVLTDVVGIILLFPPSRSLVKRTAAAWFRKHVQVQIGRMNSGFPADSGRAAPYAHDQIIDAKVLGTRVEDAKQTRS